MWFQHGMIEEPADLVDRHPELVAGMVDSGRRLARRIKGEQRLAAGVVTVPPRSPGCAFLPEPDRVMYCVHSTPAFNSNGYSTRTRGVAQGVASCGVDLEVVARAGYPWDTTTDVPCPEAVRTECLVDEIPYVHIPGSSLSEAPIDHYIVEAADAFTREARRLRPSLIQAASNFRTALPALICARRVGVPFVYEVRGFWELSAAAAKSGFDGSEQFGLQAAMELLVCREADQVLVITKQVRENLVRRGVPADRITVAPNAVNPEVFLPLPRDTDFAQAKKIRTDVPVIGFAGSMVGYEGLDTLLSASAILRERGIEHQVVIAGSGSVTEALKAQRDELSLDTVTFLGRLPQDQMPRLMSTFDIMPMPRHSLAVTQMVSPLKPLEAFSCMKAVVLSDVAPHQDLAGPGQDRALLFRAGDADALADSLQRLVEDANLRQDLGRRARLWTLDERQWKHVGATIASAHRLAVERVASVRDRMEPMSLGELRIGLIADEFTTRTLAPSVRLFPLDRNGWRRQVDEGQLDLVLVESAWSGTDGQWRRAIGDYGPDEHRDIEELLSACRSQGIPTVFWNKEDPVHFDRFRSTAAMCDHVFTTDANRIPDYLATPDAVSRTVSTMSFHAQPAIHNPLPPAMSPNPTIAYAGTYYGDRYPQRSMELRRLLEAAAPLGLTIYDRQAALPESTYHFPADLARHSVGALPYEQVIDSYKVHLAHLNVNSVTDSPSMYSRRVVEIAACGGVVVSGPGRGVSETFGDAIPIPVDELGRRTLLVGLAHAPQARLAEAWRQMRAVLRSHTVDTEMTILLRTIGLCVEAPVRDDYSLHLVEPSPELLAAVAGQSVRPREVFVDDVETAGDALSGSGIVVRPASAVTDVRARWCGLVREVPSRTYFEDLLSATHYGIWRRIVVAAGEEVRPGTPLARPRHTNGSHEGLVRQEVVARVGSVKAALEEPCDEGVELTLPSPVIPSTAPDMVMGNDKGTLPARTVLVAGHDLKFASGLMSQLEADGHRVLVDQWADHSQHDEDLSIELLRQAEVVFCEWGLGNAVWYSQHVGTDQRLVVRVHSQELFRPYLASIKHAAVDQYVFVAPLIQQAAITSHGLPADRCRVVPNAVDVAGLQLQKHVGAEFNLGLVGIVPRSKRLDRAIDVLTELLARNNRYRLFVKGKQPSDYPWMASRPDEMAFYGAVYERIERLNEQYPGCVVFDPHGDDMSEWFRKVGVALSTSDFESFHFTIADGAASGALPACLEWPGADLLYPREWLAASPAELAESILSRRGLRRDEDQVIARSCDASAVLPSLARAVVDG
ncbi:glycosyltransferase [Luteococcus sp.]|uniref:glycosyltransferase n=1 Tax=Luteococcus sp. TaxID=1969402 RepID=UPI00373545ED